MKSFAVLALAGAALAMPQGQAVTSAVAPKETTPAGCTTSYNGNFMISIVNVTTTGKRSLEARQDKALTMTLKNGILIDDLGRTGYIASNNQFQFDGPAQAGAIYTAGWSACSNGTLALGDSAIFYKCLSGTFYNLYDESTGAQCSQIYIDIIPSTGAAATTASGAASQIADGQVTAKPVTQIRDGQIQATTGAVVTQISDGQIQAASSISRAASTSRAVVTQISDGQIQAASSTSRVVVTQISDGQIQQPATTSARVATTSRAVVSQISDGQIQAPTNVTTPTRAASPTVSVFTGSAASIQAGLFGVVAGVLAMAML